MVSVRTIFVLANESIDAKKFILQKNLLNVCHWMWLMPDSRILLSKLGIVSHMHVTQGIYLLQVTLSEHVNKRMGNHSGMAPNLNAQVRNV